jgi:hypothetical protein
MVHMVHMVHTAGACLPVAARLPGRWPLAARLPGRWP